MRGSGERWVDRWCLHASFGGVEHDMEPTCVHQALRGQRHAGRSPAHPCPTHPLPALPPLVVKQLAGGGGGEDGAGAAAGQWRRRGGGSWCWGCGWPPGRGAGCCQGPCGCAGGGCVQVGGGAGGQGCGAAKPAARAGCVAGAGECRHGAGWAQACSAGCGGASERRAACLCPSALPHHFLLAPSMAFTAPAVPTPHLPQAS